MTRRVLCFFMLFGAFAPFVKGQLVPNQKTFINDIKPGPIKSFPAQSFGKAASCGVDTVYYNYYKSSAFNAITLNTASSASAFTQWFQAPQPITISGFDFYAFQSAGTSAVVTLTCNIYLATSDSLPLGNPLRTITVNVDSSFGGGLLSVMRKHAQFPTPVTVSAPYIVSVETNSTVNVSVICNSYTNGDGRAEWLAGAKIQGNWLRSHGINVAQQSFDADFILKPTVSYTLTSDFFYSGGCNEGNTYYTFTNSSSAIMQNKYYNRYAYYNIAQFGFQWDYGDTTFIQYAINTNHTYTKRLPYTVMLKDTMYGWTVGCADYSYKTIPYRPLPPSAWNDGPVCSGDSINLFADTLPGLQYQWSGPKGFTSTKQNPVLHLGDTGMNGDYRVNVKYGTCVSGDSITTVLIHQTPQKPSVTNDGPKCVGDSVSFSASSPSPGITYYWSGPNGFTDNTSAFRFYSLDTTDVGTYFVYVKDANCISDTDSTVLYTYPHPIAPLIMSERGDSLCQGDSLFLKGQSVVGAAFEWQGPNGFTSLQTNPLIVADDTAYSGLYVSKVVIGSCTSEEDSLWISVFPTPVTMPIQGSDTSTEGYTKMYQSTEATGDMAVWVCLGGTIENYDSITGIVTVKWGTPGTGHLKVTHYNEHGCFGEFEQFEVIINELPPPDNTSLKKPENSNWNVYPNPAAGNFYISSQGHATPESYTLYALDGKALSKGSISADGMDCSQLPAGIYLLELQLDTYRERHLIQVISR